MSCLPLLCCLAFVCPVRAITIDELEVIVRGPPSQHAADTDDLFGYSAALHNLVDPVTSGSNFKNITRSARILVGVPNGSTANHRVTQTGYVLQCPLSPGPCSPLRGSGEGNDTMLYDETSNANNEEKKEQFLGVAMESRNGRFAVCGHRWKYRPPIGSQRPPQGKCLVSGRLLREFQLVKPCTPAANAELLSREDTEERYFDYCLSGTDMSFLDDGSLAIGAPGYRYWDGAGFLYSGSGMAPVTVATRYSLVSYGGMSVGQARITNPDKQEWLMSAPRANNLFGEVHIFTSDVGSIQSTDQSGTHFRELMFTLTGSQIGAFFGYSLGGVDFNGDGFEDVLVGAPLYFKGSSLPEVGAVYIYENTVTNNFGSLDTNRRTILTAPGGGVAYSRFGHAIAPLGDLDDDGFDDVAISAPFGQGLSGTVYIYRGSRQGIITTPAQTLVGSELNLLPSAVSGLTSFGAFLSGTTDVDGNQYNDLIIGAFMSRKVFVMRSRTVATIVGMVQPISTSVTIGSQRYCPLDYSAHHCFQVQYCLSVKGKGFREDQLIAVNYILYADKRNSGLQPRATFSSGGSVFSGQIALMVNSNDSWCSNFTLYIQTSTSEQLLIPLRPAMEVSVPQGHLPSRSDGNQEPTDLTENRIYVQTDGIFSAQVAGNKECLRTLCSVDVYVKGNPINYISHVDSTFRDNFLLAGVVSDIVLSTTVGNTGPEAAYNVKLVFSHPPSLTLSRVEGGAQFMCETDRTATQTVCSTPNGLSSGTELKVPVRFVIDSNRFDASVNSIMVSVEIQVEDDDSDRANNIHTYQIPVRLTVSPAVFINLSEDELPVVATVNRNDLPESIDQIGRGVNVTVTITNDGPSAIGHGRLTIYVPYRSPCTKKSFLLYLHSIHSQGMQCTISPRNALDTLRLTPADKGVQLSIQSDNRGAHLEDIVGNCSDAGSTVHIICDATIPGCATVVCYVNAHRKGAVHSVRVSSYLDDFFYKDVQTSYKLFFRAVYEEVLSSNITATSTTSATDIVSLLVKKSNVVVSTTVEAWLIVVPLVAVIVFIVGLTGFLWICGFFKRKRSWRTKDSYDFNNEDDNDCYKEDDKYSANEGGKDCGDEGDNDYGNEGDNDCGNEGDNDCGNEGDNDCGDEGDNDCGNEGDNDCGDEGDDDCGDENDNGCGDGDNDCDSEGDKVCDNEDDKGCGDEGDKDCDNEDDKGCGDEGDKDCGNEDDNGCGNAGDNDCGDEGGNDSDDEGNNVCDDEK